MRDVKLVRLSDDGTHVVLIHEGTGEEFALRIDDRLRGFVTSDRARVAQLPVERPSRLSPKEIQARLRAGESSEDIAAAADVSLERVMRYAGPVLAEREYVAEQAQSALLRRPPGSAQNGAQGRALGSTVTDRLEALGTASGQIRWDAWRMPDGRWAVAVFYHLPGTTQEAQATFGFDPVGRTVLPIDDAGEWILGERTPQQQTTTTVEGPGPRTPRDARPRLTAVPAPPGDEPEGESADHPDSVVRTLRPAHTPERRATPSAPTGERIDHTAPASTGGSDETLADDRIAYEPTVDLSRSLHDQPQPAPGQTAGSAPPPATPPTPPAVAGPEARRASERSDGRPGPSRQSSYPEPPRLSPADLPDLGESTRQQVSPPGPTPDPTPASPVFEPPRGQDEARHEVSEELVAPEHDVAPAEPTPTAPQPQTERVEQTEHPEPAPEAPVAEAPSGDDTPEVPTPTPSTSVDGPPAAETEPVARTAAPAEAAASTEQPAQAVPDGSGPSGPTTADLAPVEQAAEPTATEPAAPAAGTREATPTEQTSDETAPAPEPAPEPVTDQPAARQPATAPPVERPVEQPAEQPAATRNGDAPAQTEDQPAAKQAETPEQQTETDRESKDTATKDSAATTKKALGQDRRTSGNRRRRAAGSRRKGAVPSWDDILFGGGSRKD